MSGTVKTDAALLAEFADGQPDGSITAGDVRDIIVSETAHIAAAVAVETARAMAAEAAISAGGVTLSALTAIIAAVPTSLPGSAGVLWLNGNVLQIS